MGSLQIPVSVAFFFVNSSLERIAAFYPSPAGATESLLPLDAWDERRRGQPRAGDARARRRGDPRADRARREAPECFLVPIDACYELVGQLRSWRGFDGGTRPRRARRVLRPTGHASEARGEPSLLPSRSLDARAEPYAAVPTLMLRLRITETTGAPVHARRPPLPDQDRATTPAVRDRAKRTVCRAVRRDAAVGRHAAPVPVDPRRASRSRLHRLHRDRPAGHVHVRLRGRGGQVPPRARDGEIPLVLLFSGTVFSRRRRASRPSRCRGTPRPPTGCPWRRGGR